MAIDRSKISKLAENHMAMGRVDRAILICSSGVGMNICANKVPGARAAPAPPEQRPALPR